MRGDTFISFTIIHFQLFHSIQCVFLHGVMDKAVDSGSCGPRFKPSLRHYFFFIYIIKAGVCLFVCQHSNVRTLTSPPVLKLWGTQGYLWLPYDLTEVIKLIGERFEPKKYFFSKKYSMSFLPHYCHSFHSTVIPSGLLSFLPDYCHSFRIIVIPSVLVSFLPY